ncbi:MAG: hypothetical protein FJ399_11565 [Verrucomicrobia bacterium]|nr:hypothetical protein [Verrucomicrobiota bacterium]
MAKPTAHMRKQNKPATQVRPELRPDAAGIDLGAAVHHVAVPAERDKQPDEVVRTLLFQKFGFDVTAVDGVNTRVGYTWFTEVGPDLSRFASPENFCS